MKGKEGREKVDTHQSRMCCVGFSEYYHCPVPPGHDREGEPHRLPAV